MNRSPQIIMIVETLEKSQNERLAEWVSARAEFRSWIENIRPESIFQEALAKSIEKSR
jgi:hypothetical protein